MKDIQNQLGWSNLSMASRYVHMLEGGAKKSDGMMDRLFGPKPDAPTIEAGPGATTA